MREKGAAIVLYFYISNLVGFAASLLISVMQVVISQSYGERMKALKRKLNASKVSHYVTDMTYKSVAVTSYADRP